MPLSPSRVVLYKGNKVLGRRARLGGSGQPKLDFLKKGSSTAVGDWVPSGGVAASTVVRWLPFADDKDLYTMSNPHGASEAYQLKGFLLRDYGRSRNPLATRPAPSRVGPGGTTLVDGVPHAFGLEPSYSRGVARGYTDGEIKSHFDARMQPRVETFGWDDENSVQREKKYLITNRPLSEVWAPPPPIEENTVLRDYTAWRPLTADEAAPPAVIATSSPSEASTKPATVVTRHSHVFDRWTRWPNAAGIPFPIVNINGEVLRTAVLDPYVFDTPPRPDILKRVIQLLYLTRTLDLQPQMSDRTQWGFPMGRVHPRDTGRTRHTTWRHRAVRTFKSHGTYTARALQKADTRPMLRPEHQQGYFLPRRLQILAFRMALTLKRLQGKLIIVDELRTLTSSPYELAEMVRRLGAFEGEAWPHGALLVNGGTSEKEIFDDSQIPGFTEDAWKRCVDLGLYMVPPKVTTVLDIMMRPLTIMTEGALQQITRKLNVEKVLRAPLDLKQKFPVLLAERGERSFTPEEVYDEDYDVKYDDILNLSEADLRKKFLEVQSRRRIFKYERNILDLERMHQHEKVRETSRGIPQPTFHKPETLNPLAPFKFGHWDLQKKYAITTPIHPRHSTAPWNRRGAHLQSLHNMGNVSQASWGFYSGSSADPY